MQPKLALNNDALRRISREPRTRPKAGSRAKIRKETLPDYYQVCYKGDDWRMDDLKLPPFSLIFPDGYEIPQRTLLAIESTVSELKKL